MRTEKLRAKIKGYENGTPHERKIAEEITLSGNHNKIVEIRGENTGGPDFIREDGKYWDVKRALGTGNGTLHSIINKLKKQFGNDDSIALGLTRRDARGIIDLRTFPLTPSTGKTWNNPERVRAELSRLSANGGLKNVAELEILTSFGAIKWIRP